MLSLDWEMMKTKVVTILTGRSYRNVSHLLRDKSASRVLWLEILFNDQLPWEKYVKFAIVKEQYQKARLWHREFKSLLQSCGIKRNKFRAISPLVRLRDLKDYRKFIEVLHYVS